MNIQNFIFQEELKKQLEREALEKEGLLVNPDEFRLRGVNTPETMDPNPPLTAKGPGPASRGTGAQTFPYKGGGNEPGAQTPPPKTAGFLKQQEQGSNERSFMDRWMSNPLTQIGFGLISQHGKEGGSVGQGIGAGLNSYDKFQRTMAYKEEQRAKQDEMKRKRQAMEQMAQQNPEYATEIRAGLGSQALALKAQEQSRQREEARLAQLAEKYPQYAAEINAGLGAQALQARNNQMQAKLQWERELQAKKDAAQGIYATPYQRSQTMKNLVATGKLEELDIKQQEYITGKAQDVDAAETKYNTLKEEVEQQVAADPQNVDKLKIADLSIAKKDLERKRQDFRLAQNDPEGKLEQDIKDSSTERRIKLRDHKEKNIEKTSERIESIRKDQQTKRNIADIKNIIIKYEGISPGFWNRWQATKDLAQFLQDEMNATDYEIMDQRFSEIGLNILTGMADGMSRIVDSEADRERFQRTIGSFEMTIGGIINYLDHLEKFKDTALDDYKLIDPEMDRIIGYGGLDGTLEPESPEGWDEFATNYMTRLRKEQLANQAATTRKGRREQVIQNSPRGQLTRGQVNQNNQVDQNDPLKSIKDKHGLK